MHSWICQGARFFSGRRPAIAPSFIALFPLADFDYEYEFFSYEYNEAGSPFP